MSEIPSTRHVLETLGKDLSFDKLRSKYPALSDKQWRDILLSAAAKFDGQGSRSPAGAAQAAPRKSKKEYPLPPEGTWIANIDGGSRGNPGPAASAAFVRAPEGTIDLKRAIGHETNNVAEYEALLLVLEAASERGIKNLQVRSDSELLVKQMKGQYRVKNHNLAHRFIKAKNFEKLFKSFTISHVPREENEEADSLVNQVLDEKK